MIALCKPAWQKITYVRNLEKFDSKMARYKICPIGNAVLLKKNTIMKRSNCKRMWLYENGDKRLIINLIKHIRI